MLDICRARLVDTSTSIARRGRSLGVTDMLSMSFNRLSTGKLKNVFRGILISVQMLAAVFAFELAHFQTKAAVYVSAGIAPPAAWEESVCYAQLAAIPGTLVSQHRTELPKAGATDMLCEFVVLDHAAHVQVLDCQNIEPAHQICGELVQCVLPAVGDLGVQTSHFQPLLIPTATALDATGENPLQSRQPCGVAGSVAWVGYSSAVTQGCQTANSKVNPDLASSLGERGLGWFIQTKTHEIASIPALGYRAGSRLARETATPFDMKPTDFGNCEVAVCRIPFETARMVFGGLLAVLGSKPWIGCPLGKEIGERSLQVPQCLLLWDAGRFTQKSKLAGITMFSPSRAAGVVIDRLAVFEAVRAEAQGKIVGVPDTAELPRQLPRLAVCRVASECHANFHLQESDTSCKVCQMLISTTEKAGLKPRGFQPIRNG